MYKSFKSLAILALASLPFALGCGGGGGGGQANAATSVVALSASGSSETPSSADCSQAVPLPGSLQATWNETEQCTEISSAPPKVVFSPTVDCPRSGKHQCLATVPFFACSNDPSQACGAVGRFLPQCGAIELPNSYSGAAAHEMIHYLLRASGRGDWASHSASEFVCQ